MQHSYNTDRTWSDLALPQIRRLIGPELLVATPDEIDWQDAADLMFVRTRIDCLVACRVRRPGFADSFPNQFTIRSLRPNGRYTELRKIISGKADMMFYGHAIDLEVTAITPWWLIDLGAFRIQLFRDYELMRCGNPSSLKIDRDIKNEDGTEFWAFDLTTFSADPPIVVASS